VAKIAFEQLLPTSITQGVGFGNFASVGLFAFYVLMYIIVIGGGFFFYYYYMIRFNHKVVIFKKSGDVNLIVEDRGQIHRTKGGQQSFRFLKKKNVSLPVPDYKFTCPTTKGKPVLFFYQFSDSELVPLNVDVSTNPGITLTPLEADMRNWFVLTQKAINERYNQPSFWQTYGGIVSVFGVMIFTVIALWMTLGKINDLGGSMAALGNSIKEAAIALGQQAVPGAAP
tara:strand:- start:1916 stop:2596 length:681 start_codon:yes stop_codon:yes gene_type:complete